MLVGVGLGKTHGSIATRSRSPPTPTHIK